MKKLLLLALLCTGFAQAQMVNIPDANFKAQLISQNVDTNADGQIQQSEALAASNLIIMPTPEVSDLTGLETFINLQSLSVNCPLITALNVTTLTNLLSLGCYGNTNMTTLMLGTLPNLVNLECTGSKLQALDLSGCLNLKSVDASLNYLKSFNAAGCTLLTDIDIHNNFLESFNVNGCNALKKIVLFTNKLTALNLANFPNLNYVSADSNLIKTADLSGCSSLKNLNLENNLLNTLFIKNGVNEAINFNAYYLKYICADDSQIESLQNMLTQNGYTNVTVNSYCSFAPGGAYNTITGTAHFDGNNNGCDAADMVYSNLKINVADGTNSGAVFSKNTGVYEFNIQQPNITLTPAIENPGYFSISPATASLSFPTNNNSTQTQDFCIAANGVHNDVEIAIAPIGTARPGFDATYELVYRNKGNQTLSGSVSLAYDDAVLDYVAATVAPNAQSTGSLSWNYSNLQPFESRSLYVALNVNTPTETPAVNIGDQLTYVATITPISGDEMPGDNSMSLIQTVVGSYDPNDITCLEGNTVSPTQIGNFLHYNINFENTGTAAAQNIVVKDLMDATKFDLNSLQLMQASHPVSLKVTGNKLEFIFENINLGASQHGNVVFKIKTQNSLITGDSVANKADIFFDYNYSVATNTANTTFQALSNSNFTTDASISLFPNPTTDFVTVKANSILKSAQLFDVQGRILSTSLLNESKTKIDLSSYPAGIYFVKIHSEKGMKTEKLVKK